MKKIILLFVVLFLSGCTNKYEEYKVVSDAVVSLLENKNYENESLNDNQKYMLEKFEKNISNPKINVNDFIIYSEEFKTTQENSEGIYVEDNNCYIRYNDIKFENPNDIHTEESANLICSGYFVVIPHDSVRPIDLNNQDSKYNYRYVGYLDENSYSFVYRSYYDGSGLIVRIDDDITLEFGDIDNLELKQYKKKNLSSYIFSIVFIVLLVVFLIFLKKKENNLYK